MNVYDKGRLVNKVKTHFLHDKKKPSFVLMLNKDLLDFFGFLREMFFGPLPASSLGFAENQVNFFLSNALILSQKKNRMFHTRDILIPMRREIQIRMP